MEFPKKSWGALRAQEMALELVSLESASDYAKWMGSSTSPQVQMAQSYESACWPLARGETAPHVCYRERLAIYFKPIFR
jgi:hypothetical protein